jgi:DNA ligase-1
MLYSKDKRGNARWWEAKIEERSNDQVFIVKRYGLLNGKTTETEVEIKSGKNIGKSNETTKMQQAISMVNSLYKKQRDAGYVDKVDELESRINVLPMLADKWETKSHKIEETFFVQPKLDGVRMMIGKMNGTIIMKSRTGKDVLHLNHIKSEVENFLSEGDFLDGENYSSTIPFEEITGMCRTTLDSSASSKNLEEIQFHIFDTFNIKNTKVPFSKRFSKLENFFKGKKFNFIKLVPTEKCNRENLQSKHSMFMSQGYEGTMIRNPNGPYSMSERSSQLLKMKDFQTEEYRIVGAIEASGRDVETVIWVCEMPDGRKFNVRPKGTQEQRRDWFMSKHRWTQGDKLLTVQFQNLTESGIPRFPVGLTIRDYE